MTADDTYDGFGAPVISCGVLKNGFVHENGAWVWYDTGEPLCWRRHDRRMKRVPAPPERLEALRKELYDLQAAADAALSVVERQIERGDLRERRA